eukprot:1156396-Pelagomonas_calceolata.AAC.8
MLPDVLTHSRAYCAPCLINIPHAAQPEDHFTMAVYLDDGASQPYELMASRIREGDALHPWLGHIFYVASHGMVLHALPRRCHTVKGSATCAYLP